MVSLLTPAFVDAINDVERERRVFAAEYPVMCYSDREAAEIDIALAKARREINILQTNLETVGDNYTTSIEKAIERARAGSCAIRVRILTLDPDSYFTAFRAKQLTIGVAEYRRKLHANIESVLRVLGKYSEVEVRVYDDFPTQIVFMADDDVFDCTVARGFKSRELCSFKVDLKNLGVERSFLFHFRSLWTMAEPYQRALLTPRASSARKKHKARKK